MRRAGASPSGVRAGLSSAAIAVLLAGAACSHTSEQTTATSAVPPARTAPSLGSNAASNPASNPGSLPGTTPGAPPGSTPGSAVKAGTCPAKTDLVISTKAGRRPLQVAPGQADVTLDQSVTFVIANYDVPAADVNGIFNPTTLTGDQLALSVYLTSRNGPLSPTDYLSVGQAKDAPNQLNSIAAYSAAGREIVGGGSKPNQKATITAIDKTVVCGTIDTDEATGTWVATVI